MCTWEACYTLDRIYTVCGKLRVRNEEKLQDNKTRQEKRDDFTPEKYRRTSYSRYAAFN